MALTFAVFQLSKGKNLALKHGAPVLVAVACLLVALASTAAVPVRLSEGGRPGSGARNGERELPNNITLGWCRLHFWPRNEVWTLKEGDAVQVTVEAVGLCLDDVTLTVQSPRGGRSSRVLAAGAPGMELTFGHASVARHGELLQVFLASRAEKARLVRRLNVQFAPTIQVVTTLPYQGRSLLAYFVHLLVQRQRELVTARSMAPLLGWDAGESASLRVRVEGNPKPRTIWRVKQIDIAPGESLGSHYTALAEAAVSPTASVYELRLNQVTLKMAEDGLKVAARNKLGQKTLTISVPVNIFSIESQRTFADAVSKSLALAALLFAAMVVIRVLHGVYAHVSRLAEEHCDGVTWHLVTCLLPMWTLTRLFHLGVGLCLSLGFVHYFGVQGEPLSQPRVVFLALFIVVVPLLYARYAKVRAACCMILIGLVSHAAVFLLLASTTEVLLHAAHGTTKNLVEMALQVQCVSQIHAEMYRESLLAYLSPAAKKDTEYAEVQLVKERDMAMAQASMKLRGDVALNDVQGEKLGEQKAAAHKNKKVDRQYKVNRFADVKKQGKGGGKERTKLKKKFVFKNINVCQDIGSNILIQCKKNKASVYKNCLKNFPGILVHLGKLVCGLMGKHVNCKSMYEETVKNFKCDPPVNAEEVAEGLLLLRDAPTLFYGDSSPEDLMHMYGKPVNIQFAQDKPREGHEDLLKRMEEVKDAMSLLHVIVITLLVVYSTNKVIGDIRKYNANINWENVYIGDYFRKMDARRGTLGLPRLLPLKKTEKQIYVENIFKSKPREEEKEARNLRLTLFVGVQLLTAIVFLVDYLVFTVTTYEVVRENLTYSVTIDDYLRVSAPGDSFFALLINLVFEKINVDNQVVKTFRVDKCNPRVQAPSLHLYAQQQALLLFLFLVAFVLACPDRLKHVVFRLYYPRREKKRQLKMYSDILLTRQKFVQLAFKRIVQARALGRLTLLHDPQWHEVLLRQFRSWYFVLRFFFQPTCCICKKRGGSGFAMCKGPACTMMYCRPCWQILGEKCLSCDLVITREMMQRFATEEEGL